MYVKPFRTKTRRLNHDYIGAEKETLRGYAQSVYGNPIMYLFTT